MRGVRVDKKRKSRGWVPFGYRYLGPGNDLYRGPPTTSGDRAAQKHDWEYHFLEQQQKKPKFIYSEADDEFIKNVGTQHVSEWIAKNIFQAKKRLAEKGWIEDIRPQQRAKRETTPNDWKQFLTPEKRKFTLGLSVSPDDKPLKRTKLFQNESFTNQPPSATTMTTKQGSGNEHGTTETKIDKVNPYKVFRGPPNYTFASLPFQYDAFVNDENSYARDHTFRLTSPYDPLNTIAVTDSNIGTGQQRYYGPLSDVNDTTIRQANWFSYYSGLYKYYHTISCEYTVFIENFGDPLWVYFFNINNDVPPGTASNTDMQLWNDCEYHYVNALGVGFESDGARTQGFIPKVDGADVPMENNEDNVPSGSNTADVTSFSTTNMVQTRSGTTTLTKYGSYQTGDYDNEIRLDADIENWTAINANPKLPEKLVIRVKPQSNVLEGNSTRNAGDDLKYRIRVQINYLVEFKELDYKIRYPVVTQPITVSLNDAQTGRS